MKLSAQLLVWRNMHAWKIAIIVLAGLLKMLLALLYQTGIVIDVEGTVPVHHKVQLLDGVDWAYAVCRAYIKHGHVGVR